MVIGTGLLVGFVSGAVFGTLLSFAEDRKATLDLALIRGRAREWCRRELRRDPGNAEARDSLAALDRRRVP